MKQFYQKVKVQYLPKDTEDFLQKIAVSQFKKNIKNKQFSLLIFLKINNQHKKL